MKSKDELLNENNELKEKAVINQLTIMNITKKLKKRTIKK